MPLCLSEIPNFSMVSNPFIAWKPSYTSSPGRSSRTSAGPEPVPSVQGMSTWKLTQWGWLTSQKFSLPIFEDVHSLFQHIPSVRKVRNPWWPKSATNYVQRCTIYDCKTWIKDISWPILDTQKNFLVGERKQSHWYQKTKGYILPI